MSIRSEITEIIKQLGLREEEFKEVDKHNWAGILKRIGDEFHSKCSSKDSFNYLWARWARFKKDYYYSFNYIWARFKKDYYIMTFRNDDAFEYLDLFVNEDEKVWFITESSYEGDPPEMKCWIYEGKIKAIQKVISECYGFEYYIVSKKFSWMLCESYEGQLYGTGSEIINIMKIIEKQLSSDIIYKKEDLE